MNTLTDEQIAQRYGGVSYLARKLRNLLLGNNAAVEKVITISPEQVSLLQAVSNHVEEKVSKARGKKRAPLHERYIVFSISIKSAIRCLREGSEKVEVKLRYTKGLWYSDFYTVEIHSKKDGKLMTSTCIFGLES